MTLNNGRHYLAGTLIEIIHSHTLCGSLRYALFDFDGTVSLIREGWQQVMITMMVETLLTTPEAEDEATMHRMITDFVFQSAGQPTLDQMIHLAAEVARRGGRPEEPQVYKRFYLDRLMGRVEARRAGLKSGRLDPAELVVPGVPDLLARLRSEGVTCYLASGTEREAVLAEVEILGLSGYFAGRVYGPQADGQLFSKQMVIQEILRQHHLAGCELVSFGDGPVEIEFTAEVGGIAVGVASNETERQDVNEAKRRQLIEAGADIIIPDFRESAALLDYLMGTG